MQQQGKTTETVAAGMTGPSRTLEPATSFGGPEAPGTGDPGQPADAGGGYPLDLPAADNPPMAGPGTEREGDKPRCWFDLGNDEPLVIRRPQEPPTVAVTSHQAMADGGETVDLLVVQRGEIGFIPVEDPSEFVVEPDQDPDKEGIQLVTIGEGDEKNKGLLKFTFVGSAPGTYAISAVGSRCDALASLVVKRGVVSSVDPPDPSRRVPPAQEEQEEDSPDSSAPSLWNLYRSFTSIGSGEVYQFSGGRNQEGGIPAREGPAAARSGRGGGPGSCEYECRQRWSKFQKRCGCERR